MDPPTRKVLTDPPQVVTLPHATFLLLYSLKSSYAVYQVGSPNTLVFNNNSRLSLHTSLSRVMKSFRSKTPPTSPSPLFPYWSRLPTRKIFIRSTPCWTQAQPDSTSTNGSSTDTPSTLVPFPFHSEFITQMVPITRMVSSLTKHNSSSQFKATQPKIGSMLPT